MKKLLVIAAALVTLASCSKEPKAVFETASDGSIAFSAYTGAAATKGVSVAKTDVIAADKGIGVFAFYQPAYFGSQVLFSTKRFGTPDYMYNQQVLPVIDPDDPTIVTSWEYDPVKYWPNNDGDLVSFFAYAPFREDKIWEDLGFSTDINATKLTASFPVYSEKTASEDYLFATPALNRSKQHVGYYDAVEDTIGVSPDVITFNFRHIMSRIGINIGAIMDAVPASTPKAWTETSTLITVQSIKFKGIADSYDYVYTIATGTESWSASGSQDLELTTLDFQNNTSASWTADQWYNLLAEEDVIGTSPVEQRNGYLFIAPQDLTNGELEVTFRVVTTDTANPANSSDITHTVTKPIGAVFESGKAYTLNLLIGLKSVELESVMTDWDEITPATQIDVPANTDLPSYIENGTDYGYGIKVGNLIWAPVNCGIGAIDATHPNGEFPYGKLYQFGRTAGSGYNASEGGVQTPTAATFTSGVNNNPDDAIFYKRSSNPSDWYAEDVTNQMEEWPMTAPEGTTGIGNPCPEGWRVPTYQEYLTLLPGNFIPAVSDFVSYKGQKGHWLNGTTIIDTPAATPSGYKGVFFPAAGYISAGSGDPIERNNEYGTTIGYYWATTTSLVSGSDPHRFAWTLSVGQTTAGTGTLFMAQGCSVRCVHED